MGEAGTAGRRIHHSRLRFAAWPPPGRGARAVIVRERRGVATLGVAVARRLDVRYTLGVGHAGCRCRSRIR